LIIGLWCWAAAVAWSTLFMHEHYVIDVLAGWCLAVACVRISFWQQPSNVTPTASSAAPGPCEVGGTPRSSG
jgi:membrane-associated phospholipid phosphatase